MAKYKNNIALKPNSDHWLLSCIIGLMVYFAVLSISGNLSLSKISNQWVSDLSGNITIEIPPVFKEDKKTGIQTIDHELLEGQSDTLIEILGINDKIAKVTPLSKKDLLELINPWLGSNVSNNELPLPALIDVQIKEGNILDIKELEKSLQEHVKEVKVNDHMSWSKDLYKFTSTIKIISATLSISIIILAIMIIIMTIKSRMEVHRSETELLHLLGATDRYIAHQFQSQALHSSFKGTVIGVIAALITLFIISKISSSIDSNIIPEFSLSLKQWGIIAIAPMFISCLLAMITIRITAIKELQKMQ